MASSVLDEAESVSIVSPISSCQLESDEKTAWILAFGVLLAVATVGNSLVTWYIVGRHILRET